MEEDDDDGSSCVDVGNELDVAVHGGETSGGRHVKASHAVGTTQETVDLSISSDEEDNFFMEPAGSSDEEYLREHEEKEETTTKGAMDGGQCVAGAGQKQTVAAAAGCVDVSQTLSKEREQILVSAAGGQRANGSFGPPSHDESSVPVRRLIS